MRPHWFIDLDQVHSSYLLLATLTFLVLAAGALFRIGLIGWVLRGLGFTVRCSIRRGFLLWERCLAWASWPLFLGIVSGFILVGVAGGGFVPGLRVTCGLAPLLMGTTACLAYMFIDLERYEVERGYKAVFNPLKGQDLAVHVARYGQQVRVPLLIVATVAMVAGFAMLNEGLYETIGKDWFKVEGGEEAPIYADFLAYALINLLRIVDVLKLAQSNHFLRTAYVQQAQWPASTLLTAFNSFFVLVLLQQIFASLRQGKLLTETITDLWSPHEPIHLRALNALPQYGNLAIGPLLVSLRGVATVTREQRDQLPLILAMIGPSAVPALVRHLHDPLEHVRAIVVAALGRLHALNTMPQLVTLGRDPSEMVRQSLIETLGTLGRLCRGPSSAARDKWKSKVPSRIQGHWPLATIFERGHVLGRFLRWEARALPTSHAEPVDLAVATLTSALADDAPAVRSGAARALGQIGPGAAAATSGLVGLLKDTDEQVRCQAAEALGEVGGELAATVAALVDLLQDSSVAVKGAAAQALGALKQDAASAVPALVPLLQDRDESVRTAAAQAVAQSGPLNAEAIDTLAEGLASPDTVVRAQTAEALGTIGMAAEETTEALVGALADGNDRVRAKAVEALGKIGESAAGAAVPGLMRALRDQDNWVSALAAEALGEMGESAQGAVPALVRSLGHSNPQVRGNAAEALGKMYGSSPGSCDGQETGVPALENGVRQALETATRDQDGAVRSQAIRALGVLGSPTPAAHQAVLAGLRDADSLVRIAAVESLGEWADPGEAACLGLMPLLEDANDQVKVEVIRVLPRLAGATPAVLDSLCRRLLEDGSAWVQVNAALALGNLGPAAVAAGPLLLRAAQTGEVRVRIQAMRAIAMIQPPEILAAFTFGLKDASSDIRKVASGGWIKASSIPEEVIPFLVAALCDPEVQVRTNAAHALARLDSLPAAAIPLLIACTADPNDHLRLTAALALKAAPSDAVGATMEHLLDDATVRIRLIAASVLLAAGPLHARARAVVMEASKDSSPRIRAAAAGLIESLGPAKAEFLKELRAREAIEENAELLPALDGPFVSLGTGLTATARNLGS
jgi:HEAT repeat protein